MDAFSATIDRRIGVTNMSNPELVFIHSSKSSDPDARSRQRNVYQRIHSRPCQKRPVRNVRHDAGRRKEQGNDFRNHWKHARRI